MALPATCAAPGVLGGQRAGGIYLRGARLSDRAAFVRLLLLLTHLSLRRAACHGVWGFHIEWVNWAGCWVILLVGWALGGAWSCGMRCSPHFRHGVVGRGGKRGCRGRRGAVSVRPALRARVCFMSRAPHWTLCWRMPVLLSFPTAFMNIRHRRAFPRISAPPFSLLGSLAAARFARCGRRGKRVYASVLDKGRVDSYFSRRSATALSEAHSSQNVAVRPIVLPSACCPARHLHFQFLSSARGYCPCLTRGRVGGTPHSPAKTEPCARCVGMVICCGRLRSTR